MEIQPKHSENIAHFFRGTGQVTGSALLMIGAVALVALGIGLAAASIAALGYSFYATIIVMPSLVPLVIVLNGFDVAFWCLIGYYCLLGGVGVGSKSMEIGADGIEEFKKMSNSYSSQVEILEN